MKKLTVKLVWKAFDDVQNLREYLNPKELRRSMFSFKISLKTRKRKNKKAEVSIITLLCAFVIKVNNVNFSPVKTSCFQNHGLYLYTE